MLGTAKFKKKIVSNRIAILSVLVLIFAVGCNSNVPKQEAATSMSKERQQEIADNIAKVKKEVDGLIKHAEDNRKKAASVGGEWRDISKFIKQGKKYQANGQCEKAIKVLQKAVIQGEMGYKQAVAQKKLTMPKYFSF